MKESVVTATFGFILLLLSSGFKSADQKSEEKTDPFNSLINLVLGDTLPESPLNPDLLFIIEEFYADTVIPLSVTQEALTYITEAYKDHGYSETGNWVSSTPSGLNFKYVPYEGKLPEYENSDFILPIQGRVTSNYGFRKQYGHFHRGIDISLNIGDTVKAALPGVVTKIAYQKNGYGNYVMISHNGGVETLYGHLSVSHVLPGQELKAGDPIGIGGNTGNSTAPHLHFETRYQGIAIDPFSCFDLLDQLR